MRSLLLVIVVCIACLLLPARSLQAQDFERIGVDEGLPSATLYGVVQDARGFLWVSGATGGLARYDGHEFRFYPLLDRASADGVLPDTGSLLLDRDDRLWVGTWGHGLFLLDAQRRVVANYRHREGEPDSLASDRVQALYQAPDGSVWVGTTDGLNRIGADGRIGRFSADPQGIRLQDPRVWSIAGDPRDTLWVGTSDGLHRYRAQDHSTQVFRPVAPEQAGDRRNEIRVLWIDPAGELWVGGRDAISRFDPARERFESVPVPDLVRSRGGLPPVSVLLPEPGGQLLLGTQGGVYRLDPRQRQLRAFADDLGDWAGLAGSNVRALLSDRSGVLWVATREHGLYRRIPGRQQFQTLGSLGGSLPEPLLRAAATALHVDAAGNYWFAGPPGLFKVTSAGGVQEVLTTAGSPVPGPVSALRSAPDGSLWVGSQQGLFRVARDGDRAQPVQVPLNEPGAEALSVRALHVTASGELLIGLWERGVLRWQPQQSSARWLLRDLGDEPGDAVLAIADDARGGWLVGTRYSGLFELDDRGAGRQHLFDPKRPDSSLPNNAVNAARVDAAGRLWVGTDQGLALREPGATGFRTIASADGLPDPRVVGLHAGGDGVLWVLTKRGLVRLDPSRGDIAVFTRADGLLASEFNRGAIAEDRHGQLLVGTVAGVNLFDPLHLQVNDVAPGVELTEISVDGHPTSIDADGLLRLRPGWRSLSLGFVALDFQDTRRNQFRYRLQGFDKDWRVAGRSRLATYTNLPRGRYRFEVLGSNNHGRWSPHPATLELEVVGDWWQRPELQAGLALLVIGLLWGGYRWRVFQHTQARLHLEREVERYAGELKAERDLFVGGPAVALIARIAPGWPIDYISANADSLLGLSAVDLLARGTSLRELIHPADRAAISAQVQAHIDARHRSWEQRFRLLRVDGGVRGVYGFAVVHYDAAGQASTLRGYLLDQTELIEAQRASEQFKRTLDRTRDAVLMFHADTQTVFYANQGACDLLARSAGELLSSRVGSLFPASAQSNFLYKLHALHDAPDAAVTLRSEFCRSDGSAVPVEVFLQYISSPGERARFVVFARDISERERIERMKDEFVATVSHELRTPLTSINGALGLAVGGALGPLPDPARKLLEVAQRNGQRLRMLIDDLLDMEKLEAGQLRFELVRQPVLPLIEQALESNRDYAAQWQVRLQLSSELLETLEVEIDAGRLQQVLSNLISNAAKYSPQGGEVEVRVGRSVDRLRISVRDHGPGIPPEFQPRLFEKFTQADSSDTRQKGGTGLGLAISRRLVERMQGQLSFETELGAGTTFHVDLPIPPV